MSKILRGVYVARVALPADGSALQSFAELIAAVGPAASAFRDAVRAGSIHEGLSRSGFRAAIDSFDVDGELDTSSVGLHTLWGVHLRLDCGEMIAQFGFRRLDNDGVELDIGGRLEVRELARVAGLLAPQGPWTIYSVCRPRNDLQEPELVSLHSDLTAEAIATLELPGRG